MKLGIRAKLFIVSLGVILASVVVAYVYMSTQLTRMFTERINEDLTVRAELIAMRAGEARASLEDIGAWDRLARDLSKRVGARVTFIRRDGVVLGDSGISRVRIRQTENHADRPEFRQAMHSGRGQSERSSQTLGQRMQYIAVPFSRGAEIAGVARVAMPLTQVDQALAQLRQVLSVATVLALVVAVLMSSIAAHLVSRTARSLVEAARKMAEGDLGTRTKFAGQDEFGDLGRSLDRLAHTLSSSLKRVREQRDRLGGVLSDMQEGVLMLDRAGRIALINPALREMLLLGADVVGKGPSEVIQHPELTRLLTVARSSGEAVTKELELTGLKPRIVMVRAAPLAGEPGGVFCVFVDVTEMRRLESLRRDFVSNVSHELRTPVTAIGSAAETLQVAMQKDPSAAGTFIDIIERNSARLHEVVEDLLDLSRIESREFTLELEELSLSDVFAQIIDLFQERAAKKDIRLSQQVPDDLPLGWADRSALENALSNLVDNAVKYCGSDSEVRLRAVGESQMIRVLVEDTGPGIESRHLPRLFERFYRVDTGRSRELGGTGLGLSIVKHLVEALGGGVRVESTVGKGTQFSFTIKKASPSEPPRADAD